MTDIQTHLKPYATLLKGWHDKQLGPKPTAELLSTVHALGLRPGKQALANAMALRVDGVTGAQIVMATGAPQLNRMRGLIAAGDFKRAMVAPNEQGHTVYKVTLTPKGEERVKRTSEAAANAALTGDLPAKPKVKKATGKARKPKAVPATVNPPAPVNEPAQGEPAQATA
jgi:hypothetical protein